MESKIKLFKLNKITLEEMSDKLINSIKFLSKAKSEGGLRTKNIFKTSLPNKPLITIITATFNSEKYLEESILSLHKQKYDN